VAQSFRSLYLHFFDGAYSALPDEPAPRPSTWTPEPRAALSSSPGKVTRRKSLAPEVVASRRYRAGSRHLGNRLWP